ncbi:PREDICTED: uncharacterized protein LOC108968483, partial [Bactrocera latifrons]|uniref:uncharacterized protein LOC108968483 n=1 Tax=Bactrocera latifrons TaxID=174628 RepID=UPI0008DD87B2
YLPVMLLTIGADNSLVRWVRLFLSVGSAIIYILCIVESTLKCYWFTLTIVTGLRLRYFHIIVILCDFNERLCLLCEVLKRLKAYNGFGPNLECAAWRRNNHWEFAQLNMLRLIHGRIYELLQIINEHVGWSMTLIAQEALFEFVCYTYWCLTYKLVKMGMGAVIFNFVTIFSLGCLHYQWFQQADRVKQNGEMFAAITTQLYKPCDDKRYNDLLLALLIQTMHQKLMQR